MNEQFPKPKSLGRNVNVKLNLGNYVTKSDFKKATGVDTSELAKQTS